MDDNAHDRLEAAMEERRVQLRMSWRDLANKAELSYEGLRAIRRGERNPNPVTRSRLDDALGWQAGSVARVLAGGEPVVEVSVSDGGTATDEASESRSKKPVPYERAFEQALGPFDIPSSLRRRQYSVGRQQYSVELPVDFGLGDQPPFPEPKDDTELEANETWLAAKHLETVMQRQRQRRQRKDVGDVG